MQLFHVRYKNLVLSFRITFKIVFVSKFVCCTVACCVCSCTRLSFTHSLTISLPFSVYLNWSRIFLCRNLSLNLPGASQTTAFLVFHFFQKRQSSNSAKNFVERDSSIDLHPAPLALVWFCLYAVSYIYHVFLTLYAFSRSHIRWACEGRGGVCVGVAAESVLGLAILLTHNSN